MIRMIHYMSHAINIDELLALPADQRLDLAQKLWASLAADPSSVPVPEWHRQLLRQRMESYEKDRQAGEPWETVMERLSRRPKP